MKVVISCDIDNININNNIEEINHIVHYILNYFSSKKRVELGWRFFHNRSRAVERGGQFHSWESICQTDTFYNNLLSHIDVSNNKLEKNDITPLTQLMRVLASVLGDFPWDDKTLEQQDSLKQWNNVILFGKIIDDPSLSEVLPRIVKAFKQRRIYLHWIDFSDKSNHQSLLTTLANNINVIPYGLIRLAPYMIPLSLLLEPLDSNHLWFSSSSYKNYMNQLNITSYIKFTKLNSYVKTNSTRREYNESHEHKISGTFINVNDKIAVNMSDSFIIYGVLNREDLKYDSYNTSIGLFNSNHQSFQHIMINLCKANKIVICHHFKLGICLMIPITTQSAWFLKCEESLNNTAFYKLDWNSICKMFLDSTNQLLLSNQLSLQMQLSNDPWRFDFRKIEEIPLKPNSNIVGRIKNEIRSKLEKQNEFNKKFNEIKKQFEIKESEVNTFKTVNKNAQNNIESTKMQSNINSKDMMKVIDDNNKEIIINEQQKIVDDEKVKITNDNNKLINKNDDTNINEVGDNKKLQNTVVNSNRKIEVIERVKIEYNNCIKKENQIQYFVYTFVANLINELNNDFTIIEICNILKKLLLSKRELSKKWNDVKNIEVIERLREHEIQLLLRFEIARLSVSFNEYYKDPLPKKLQKDIAFLLGKMGLWLDISKGIGSYMNENLLERYGTIYPKTLFDLYEKIFDLSAPLSLIKLMKNDQVCKDKDQITSEHQINQEHRIENENILISPSKGPVIPIVNVDNGSVSSSHKAIVGGKTVCTPQLNTQSMSPVSTSSIERQTKYASLPPQPLNHFTSGMANMSRLFNEVQFAKKRKQEKKKKKQKSRKKRKMSEVSSKNKIVPHNTICILGSPEPKRLNRSNDLLAIAATPDKRIPKVATTSSSNIPIILSTPLRLKTDHVQPKIATPPVANTKRKRSASRKLYT